MRNRMKDYISLLFKRMKWLLLIISIFALIGLSGYLTIFFGGRFIVDDESLILDAITTIETTDGHIIGELYNEKRSLVAIDEVPQHVQDAFIAIEDRRFYQHAGVDFKSIVRAVYRDIVAFEKVEGASTITQQLSKNLFLSNEKTLMRKTKEIMAATYLERNFSKDEILELYLNEIYFGQGVYGIEEASLKFFSKPAKDLEIAEGALLAGLAKGPNGYSPIKHAEKSLARRNIVLQAMDRFGVLSTEERLKEQGKTLGLQLQKSEENPSVDSYLDLVIEESADKYKLSLDELKRGGYRIVVNLDEVAQKIAYDAFKVDDYFPGNTTESEGAFIMMDQASGKVITVIGGRNYRMGDLNRATVKRQPGSVIKPLAVYGPAMMKKAYKPYTLIKDEEKDYDGYTATNYDGDYAGKVSMYDALKASKNAPAVWLLNEIGINYAKDYLKKMSMPIKDEGLAIALGGLSEGLTPLDLIRGYRTFVHNGEMIDPYTIERIYNGEEEVIVEAKHVNVEVFSPQVAWNMTEMLVGTVESGTAKVGEYAKALAGKTGSTQHPFVEGMTKDAWFVGYTPEYVSALWMGYDRSDEAHFLTGSSEYPTELTKAILTEIDKERPLTAKFEKPKDVKAVPKPIDLPKVESIHIKYIFGGFSLVKGELTWSGSDDDRVIYRIYRVGTDKHIGEVQGKTKFIIDNVALFKSEQYYIVPYNKLTEVEGEASEKVELSI